MVELNLGGVRLSSLGEIGVSGPCQILARLVWRMCAAAGFYASAEETMHDHAREELLQEAQARKNSES